MSNDVLLLCPLHEPTQQALEQRFRVHRLFEASHPAALLDSLAGSLEAVATDSHTGFKAELATALPRLRIVSSFGVGIDAIDLDACRAARIAVCNTPEVLTEDVADLALALTLASVRRVVAADRYVRDGRWLERHMALTDSLQGAKVGIIGLGRIGQAIARRCLAFNTTVAYHGPRRKPDQPYEFFDDPAALARWADVLIVACPGGAATRGLVSREVLEALGPTSHLVNIARGSVVDEAALVELLGARRIGGAALDVFVDEPRVPQALQLMDHVVLQPHQASATHRTRTAMGKLVIDNLAAHFAGLPLLTPVN